MSRWNLDGIECHLGLSNDFACDHLLMNDIRIENDAGKAARLVPKRERMIFIENNIEALAASGKLEEVLIGFYSLLNFHFRSYDLFTWECVFGMCDRDRLLSAGDTLPDDLGSPFTIYRGQDLSEEVGMSWTLSRDRAEWFAQRNAEHIDEDGETGVIEMQVTVEDILFYDNGREEQEVVVDPNLVLFSLSPKEEQQYNNSNLPSTLAI